MENETISPGSEADGSVVQGRPIAGRGSDRPYSIENQAMNAPLNDRMALNARPRGLGGWLGVVVIVATVVATAIVLLCYFTPGIFSPASQGARYGYAFIGSLMLSVGGGVALMIRQNNPGWLLTAPWAAVFVAVLVAIARAMVLAAMH